MWCGSDMKIGPNAKATALTNAGAVLGFAYIDSEDMGGQGTSLQPMLDARESSPLVGDPPQSNLLLQKSHWSEGRWQRLLSGGYIS